LHTPEYAGSLLSGFQMYHPLVKEGTSSGRRIVCAKKNAENLFPAARDPQ
jgi:hypothetical protein